MLFKKRRRVNIPIQPSSFGSHNTHRGFGNAAILWADIWILFRSNSGWMGEMTVGRTSMNYVQLSAVTSCWLTWQTNASPQMISNERSCLVNHSLIELRRKETCRELSSCRDQTKECPWLAEREKKETLFWKGLADWTTTTTTTSLKLATKIFSSISIPKKPTEPWLGTRSAREQLFKPKDRLTTTPSCSHQPTSPHSSVTRRRFHQSCTVLCTLVGLSMTYF